MGPTSFRKTGWVVGCIVLTALIAMAFTDMGSRDQSVPNPVEVSMSVEKGTFSVQATDVPLRDLLREISSVSGVPISVDDRLGNERVTVNVSAASLESLLSKLTKSYAVVYDKDGDRYSLTSAQITSQQDEIIPEQKAVLMTPAEVAGMEAQGILFNSMRSIKELRKPDSRAILLRNAIIDTAAAVETGKSIVVPDKFKAPEGTEYYIVQFDRAVSDEDRVALEKVGAEICHYVPHSAYTVRVAPGNLDAVRAISGVFFIEPYHPYFKMSGAVLAHSTGLSDEMTNTTFNVMSFRGADAKEALERAGYTVTREQSAGGRQVLTVQASPDEIEALIKTEQVQWIEPGIVARPANDLASPRMRASALRAMHPSLTGEGVVVGVSDSGVDYRNPGYADIQGLPNDLNQNTRILYYEARPGPYTEGLPGDVDGHGTHVSGSILGNGALSQTVISSPGSAGPPYGTNQFAGVAPRAKLVMLEDFNSFTDQEQADIMHQKGARISNNSWGYWGYFEYGPASALWDELVRDARPGVEGNQELTVFFAGGNEGDGQSDGRGGVPGTVTMPGNAKNVITVGAIEQPRFARNIVGVYFGDEQYFSEDNTDSEWQMSSFSSRGPVTGTDLRIKPDIVAPGSYVMSIQSHETNPDEYLGDFENFNVYDYRYGNVNSGTNFALFSGTSMATPLAAGAAALIQQYFTNAYGRLPSPAMMKAIMVSGARRVNSIVYRRPMFFDELEVVDDGWGVVDVMRSVSGAQIHPTDELLLLDQDETTPLGTGQLYSRQVTIGAGEGGLKVTLAYTDAAGTPGNAIQLVNDLNLIVYGPNGVVYHGNHYDPDGVHSYPRDQVYTALGDTFNNVESVVIPERPGTYTIRVVGRQVPVAPQDFALVVVKGVGLQGRTPGNFPSIALDEQNAPVIAYSHDWSVEGGQSNLTRQIFVRRWRGPIGERSMVGEWLRLEDQWFSVRDSAFGAGISMTLEKSEYPSVAVSGERVYVAWQESPQSLAGSVEHIFFKAFNGTDWVEYANSAQGNGLSGNTTHPAVRPVVQTAGDGHPIVAWIQEGDSPNLSRVFLKKWDGTNWVGLAGSHTNGLPSSANPKIASQLSMVIQNGEPVVAWQEATVPSGVVVLRWTGASWSNISPANSAPLVSSPKLGIGADGMLYLAWIQTYGAAPGQYLSEQVYALRRVGAAWQAMGGSTTFPGITAATNGIQTPVSVGIGGAADGRVIVTWIGGFAGTNAVFSKSWTPGGPTWVTLGGAGLPRGMTGEPRPYHGMALAVDPLGTPFATFVGTVYDPDVQEVLTYSLVADRDPPVFGGLLSAVGGTNNDVTLTWSAASDNFSTSIMYRVYRGTNGWNCWDVPMCSASDVFLTNNIIATVTNLTSFTVTNLPNYIQYCYGVRAVDEGGMAESNMVSRFAAPSTPGVDCFDVDTDSDGLPDWWEVLHFGGTTNADPTVTNVVGGLNNLDAYVWGTDPFSPDSDSDALTDWSEVYFYGTHPAIADTDRDGLDDGAEVAIGSDPLRADSNNNHISDGDMWQLGYDDPSAASVNLRILDYESFETSSRTNWQSKAPNAFLPFDLWHLSTAEPVPKTNNVTYIEDRSTTTAYRVAADPTFSNPDATYNVGTPLICALDSPSYDATTYSNLLVQWKEYYETEPFKDFVQVQARSAEQTNWVVVSTPRAGLSEGWRIGRADLSRFAGNSNVQVRFLFSADLINNGFAGWYVDDVMIYEGVTIRGWVRDVNGRPLLSATVSAIGRGLITNVVGGHQHVRAGKIIAETLTAEDGSYELKGLPQGWYYIKGDEPNHRSEFWNGTLFTEPYAFGQQLNPGVFALDEVGPAGYVDLTAPGAVTNAHFELERGESRTLLSVAHTAGAGEEVYVNSSAAHVWDGDTNPLSAAFVPYLAAANLSVTNNRPDWLLNPVQPSLLGGLAPGDHCVIMGTNLWQIGQAGVTVREGEITRVNVVTNGGRGYIYVASLDGVSHPIYLNGLSTGLNTPALVQVQAGTHLVQLVPGIDSYGITPTEVLVRPGARTNVSISAASISGVAGSLQIDTRDSFGSVVTGASIYVNGRLVTGSITPTTIGGLRPGFHYVSVELDGFRRSEVRRVQILSGETAFTQFGLFQSDADYDRVGDWTEILGYTNVFLYHRNDDPDADGLSNLQEFELFRNFGITLNPFDPDTDGDGMQDGFEVGYDGYLNTGDHVMFALSSLATNAVQGTNSIRVRFVGRYLEGICNFGLLSDTQFIAAIDGDRIVATSMTNTAPAVPTKLSAETVFAGIPSSVVTRAVSRGHQSGTRVFADTMPHMLDTDRDGMWDGFEFQHKFMTNAFGTVLRILDPIETGGNNDDPDYDGLSNYLEFLGPDGMAETMNWTDPRNPDTDGDGMPDGWEYFYGFNPTDPSDKWTDPDEDGLPNFLEYVFGSNPRMFDTDGDGLSDGDEFFLYGTDPLNPDTDGDGLLDGLEVQLGTDPTKWDTDGDGMPDGFEVLDAFGNLRPPELRLNPLDPTDADLDYSGDGMSNLENYLVRDGLVGNMPEGVIWDYWLDPFSTDSDGDGMPDSYEVYFGLHPMDPIITREDESHTRYAELAVGGDPDGDGLWNIREYRIRFHLDPDGDAFTMPGRSTNPRKADTDDDGLGDGEEDRALRSDPTLQDTDGEGLVDGAGIEEKWGELESSRRNAFYGLYASTNPAPFTFRDALRQSQIPSPFANEGYMGRLATIRDEETQTEIETWLQTQILTGDIALGAFISSDEDFYWLPNFEFTITTNVTTFHLGSVIDLTYANWEADSPSNALGMVGMRGTGPNFGQWFTIPSSFEAVFDHFIVEWPDSVESVTNHYDQALNDLWQLVWPGPSDLPHWQQVELAPDSPIPPPRWGHAASYVPVYETKLPRDRTPASDAATITLMDNRQLVVLGGRNGVTKFTDIWEYRIRSNMWYRSEIALDSLDARFLEGRSEFQAITKYAYRNTGPGLPDFALFDPKDDGFGLPTERPYEDSRSMDWTYLFGGWDNVNSYYEGQIYYKSSDDQRPITETLHPEGGAAGVTEYVLAVPGPGDIIGSGTMNGSTRFAIGNGVSLSIDGLTGVRDLTGYAALNFAAFALITNTHEIVSAELVLDVRRAPASSFDVDVLAEITKELKHSETEYNSNPDELEPSLRVGGALFFNSRITNFAMPVAPFIGTVSIDVTDLVRDVLENPDQFDGSTIGFVFHAPAATDYGLIRTENSRIVVAYKPRYRIPPEWRGPSTLFYEHYVRKLEKRKSHAMAYDQNKDRVVLFGGIDGNDVLGDTHEGTLRITSNPRWIWWKELPPGGATPPARWGHSMVYDAKNERFVMFGGFDANHRPLNDLWFFYPSEIEESIDIDADGGETISQVVTSFGYWEQVTEYRTTDRPQPRGGASMIYWGDFDWDRAIDGYGVSGNKRKIVMFGGTDGKTYFNDTWVLDDSELPRWVLVNPVGEQSQSPTPRAFATFTWAQNARLLPDIDGGAEYRENVSPPDGPNAKPAALLFGGRTGLLPTGRDTDGDMVEDGMEHALGGPAAGRDPRVSKLAQPDHPTETLPFAYLRIGSRPSADIWPRGLIANMESLRHDDGIYAIGMGLPWESWPHPDSFVGVSGGDPEPGVETRVPSQIRLWYSRHGVGDEHDPRNVWELGVPDNSIVGTVRAPAYAYSGRWVFGTDLNGNYPNDATMELYSPLFSLELPNPNSSSTNMGSYFLIFHEWLDLADANDKVKVDVLRPRTSADITTRRSDTNRPPITIVGERNYAYNTTGHWRRVIAPLDPVANESNLYLRFTLLSDAAGVAGGWYIDDVAIVQGGQIEGIFSNQPNAIVNLFGVNDLGEALDDTYASGSGFFQFGLLPQGQYFLYSQGATVGPITIDESNWSAFQNITNGALPFSISNFKMNSGSKVLWDADVGAMYRVDYADDILGPWSVLGTLSATNDPMDIVDTNVPLPVLRFYRVIKNP
jgi:hypothetical protein